MALGFEDIQETVTVIHPVAVDEWGDPVTGTATTVQVSVLYSPGATRELEVNENQVQADATLYIDVGAVTVSAGDRISIRGELYEVAGKPRYWNNNFTEVPVRLVTG